MTIKKWNTMTDVEQEITRERYALIIRFYAENREYLRKIGWVKASFVEHWVRSNGLNSAYLKYFEDTSLVYNHPCLYFDKYGEVNHTIERKHKKKKKKSFTRSYRYSYNDQ